MSQIKNKDTKPEILVRKFLHASGFRYRIHVKDMPGKPDIVLPKYKTIIFVNGCFWHKHETCKKGMLPKTRTEWWRQKINRNVENDKKIYEKLIGTGWTIKIIWECMLNSPDQKNTLLNLKSEILNGY